MSIVRHQLLGAIILAFGVATATLAQQARPSCQGVQMDEWYLTPVVFDEGGQTTVDSILALKDGSTATGANITVIWYLRHSGGSWETKAWETADQWSAIEYVKESLDISDDYDDIWLVFDAETTSAASAPENFSMGVMTTDPMLPVIASAENPNSVVQFLVDLGYQAAVSPAANVASGCTEDQVLDGITAGVEAAENAPSEESVSGEEVATATIQATCSALCLPWTWTSTGPSAWSAWSSPTAWGGCGSANIPLTNTKYCYYCRTRTQTRTRTLTHRYLDCSTATCSQTKTKAETQKDSCVVAQSDPCPGPSCMQIDLDGPFSATSSTTGDWLPACNW